MERDPMTFRYVDEYCNEDDPLGIAGPGEESKAAESPGESPGRWAAPDEARTGNGADPEEPDRTQRRSGPVEPEAGPGTSGGST